VSLGDSDRGKRRKEAASCVRCEVAGGGMGCARAADVIKGPCAVARGINNKHKHTREMVQVPTPTPR
jgi:hypothetical protein